MRKSLVASAALAVLLGSLACRAPGPADDAASGSTAPAPELERDAIDPSGPSLTSAGLGRVLALPAPAPLATAR
jgi:hypothetical protein